MNDFSNNFLLPILLIDNYDSYTYNLYHLIAKASCHPPTVLKNDHIPFTSSQLKNHFSAIVISPGPGTPTNENVPSKFNEIIKNTIF